MISEQPSKGRSHSGKKLSFRETTVKEFWNRAGKKAEEVTIIVFGQKQTDLYFQCCTCKRGYQYSAIQIGHKIEWKQYFARNGITSTSPWKRAMEVFNDLDNLEPQCSTCNTSHDWETVNFEDEDDTKFEERYGEPNQYEDETMDGFILLETCSTCGSDLNELFNHLVCNKCHVVSCLVTNKNVPFDNKMICTACASPLRAITENDYQDTMYPENCPNCGKEHIELYNHLACDNCKMQYCHAKMKRMSFDQTLKCYACDSALRKIEKNDFIDTLK
ncbi:MAG TPA: hypothetical protein VM689_11135 [Aliidongia sp.]|nr:hypothetical protein [Aliidongia sp.]